MKTKPVKFDELSDADLVIDQIYQGGPGGFGGEPLDKLVGGTVNQGGFRHSKPPGTRKPLYCILVTTNEKPEWPNNLDQQSGIFTYYGDNNRAGSDIHGTKGNQILKESFADAASGRWADVPLFLIFEHAGKKSRSYIFRGLAVPGGPSGISETDLVAVWKTDNTGRRFQNYRAKFTILDTGPVAMTRKWLSDIKSAHKLSSQSANDAWARYSISGKISPLTALPAITPRTKEQQEPSSQLEAQVLKAVVNFHKAMGKDGNYAFEATANRICSMMLSGATNVLGTKKSGDGGYDGVGTLKLGTLETDTTLQFLVEAKLYAGGCGVSQTKRLLSRLKTQAFGVFVTNTYVKETAQEEILEDGQKVIIVSGGDIAKILIRSGISTEEAVLNWLQT